MGGNAVKPTPSDALQDKVTGTMESADAACDTALQFVIDKPVKADTVDNRSVKLFHVAGGTYTEVPLTTVVAKAESKPEVTATPKQALTGASMYLAVVTSGVMTPDSSRPAVDQSYFGVARAALLQMDETGGTGRFLDTPIVDFDAAGKPVTWNSPYLDSRLDTLILGGSVDDISKSALASAGETMLDVLGYLEGLRHNLKPHLDFLVLGPDGKPGKPGDPGVDNVVAVREDIVMAWTFTTGTCAQQKGGTP